jgi:hypothetical protein
MKLSIMKYVCDTMVQDTDPVPGSWRMGVRRELDGVPSVYQDKAFDDLIRDMGALRTIEDANGWLAELYEWARNNNVFVS